MSLKLPKVAVLLAAYNGMRWIEEQINSILNQSAVEVSIYISVDPSDDGTEAWCAAYSIEHPAVSLLPFVGVFGGASRNFFRLISDVNFDSFDFVAFSDQDDIWYKDKLQRAISQLEVYKADAYSSNVIAFWPDGRAQLLKKAQAQVKWDFLFEAAGPGCTYVLRSGLALSLKSAILSNWLALQDVSLHDWFCYAFARSHGYIWRIDPEPTMRYRQHDSNQVGANTGWMPLIARFKTIQDGWWFRQVQLISSLVGKNSDPFVKKWLPLDKVHLLKLSLSAWQCRRRVRDKIFFFLICWVTAVAKRKS